MNADQFYAELVACRKEVERLRKAGWSGHSIELWESGLMITPLNNPGPFNEDPIMDLYSRYDVSKVNIGNICFDNVAQKKYADMEKITFHGLRLLGSDENAYLVSDTEGIVKAVEIGNVTHVYYFLALNSSMLLDAMVAAAKFLPPHLPCEGHLDVAQEYWDENIAAAKKQAMKCAEIAGIACEEDDNPYFDKLPVFADIYM